MSVSNTGTALTDSSAVGTVTAVLHLVDYAGVDDADAVAHHDHAVAPADVVVHLRGRRGGGRRRHRRLYPAD